MRICFLVPVGQIGGAERVLLDLIESIRAQEPGHQMHALLMDDGPLVAALKRAGVEPIVLPAPASVRSMGDSGMRGWRLIWSLLRGWPATRRYRRQMLAAIEKINPDVIHSNGLKCHALAADSARNRAVVWHIHDFVSDRPLIARLLRRNARGITTVAVSNAVARDIKLWLKGSAPVLILNGIDTTRFSPAPADAQSLDRLSGAAPAEKDVARVGLIATYARWKGQDVFLRAVAELTRQHPSLHARFYIVGGPIYATRGSQFSTQELMALAEELAIKDRVFFVPFQPDPLPIYRGLDIVVHASTKREPFGLTIVEAMACARAVVVIAAGGAVELITPEVDTIAIPRADAQAMCNAIARLAEDGPLRDRLGAAARQTVLAKFQRERMASQMLELYRSLLPAGAQIVKAANV
jgi:glycosyltransferase involved in cell wall biosynthesis